ncbi:hypothetical protein IW261DRAFT_1422603 [Armillaria novae-zelandiae]|uniref:Uncharacterized protein n=1 Tax=Armillaria novae-zelandiae TaxID=153914 RepID=A0AA39NZH6_9AGAR|nr:hypothetical protein IW261DRAFT_1422603 [Armillaria novae-zelandiae]
MSTRSRRLPARSNADTGHPETSSEFTKQMKDRVHVLGPRHAQEGGTVVANSDYGSQDAMNSGHSTAQSNNPSTGKSNPRKHGEPGKEKLTIQIPAKKGVPADNQAREHQSKSSRCGNHEVSDTNSITDFPGRLGAGTNESAESGLERATLLSVIPSQGGVDFEQAIQNRYKHDTLFRKVVQNPQHFKNFEWDADKGLLYLKKDTTKLLCIPQVLVNDRTVTRSHRV